MRFFSLSVLKSKIKAQKLFSSGADFNLRLFLHRSRNPPRTMNFSKRISLSAKSSARHKPPRRE